MSRKWKLILSFSLIGIIFLYGLIEYKQAYHPVPSTNALPSKQNLIVFTGIRRFSPFNIAHGLFLIDVDTGDIWQWEINEPDVSWSVQIDWISALDMLSLLGGMQLADGSFDNRRYLLSPDEVVTQTELIQYEDGGSDHSWSSDGKKVAFSYPVNKSSRIFDIYIQNIDGTNLMRVTDMQKRALSPDWSPDGSRIVFEAYELSGQKFAIYMVNSDGTNLHSLADQLGGQNRKPQWSPDGKKVAFIHAEDRNKPDGLWVLDMNSGLLAPIFTPSDPKTMGVRSFAWSPNSQQLAFASSHESGCTNHETVSAEWVNCDHRIFIINEDGSEIKTLDAHDQPDYFDFAWIHQALSED